VQNKRHPIDAPLLRAVQEHVPLAARPYGRIARQLGCDEELVLARLRRLRGPNGTIREISGVFDAVRLGYAQALVALAVDRESLPAAGRRAARHPGVSHCYARRSDACSPNLWFTLAVSSRSTLGLARTSRILADQCAADRRLLLPARTKYKLHVRFGDEGAGERGAPTSRGATAPTLPAPTDRQLRAIRALQADLPDRTHPFALLAESVALATDDLLATGREFLARGWMRRYAAAVRHRAVGAEANVMVAWKVPPSRIDAAGQTCARQRAVSHCYARRTAEGWPYNLYTMIHGRSEEQCKAVVASLAAAMRPSAFVELWTQTEFKKRRIRLFDPAEAAWEKAHA
jgi:DNA-binding Lrp family transcriptional regulator